ncbi:MAG: acylphosphatase [Thermofilum sp. ex4484_79]|nr:MAG: acylphosphatase [Thermofilum sp. ex4484_79]
MGKLVRAHIFISGIVQGVFFRASMKEVAELHNVKGWVKNLPDGRVEAVLEGDEDFVKEVIKWAHKGPRWARVEKVEIYWEPYKGEYDSFRIVYY